MTTDPALTVGALRRLLADPEVAGLPDATLLRVAMPVSDRPDDGDELLAVTGVQVRPDGADSGFGATHLRLEARLQTSSESDQAFGIDPA